MINLQKLASASPKHKEDFKTAQKQYNQLLKDEIKFIEDRLSKSKNITETSWLIINEITGNKNDIQPYFENGFLGAETLNRFFNEKPNELISQNLPSEHSYECNIPNNKNIFHFQEINTQKLLEIGNKIEGKKSAGYDDVPTYLLKKSLPFFSKPLTHIISSS
ncbi:hypothetical protein JTB14_008381 [Gonioctena quinquepunctata]|nr:hypothetical protein JTB14_008381 [Gonioctena quinquepunctata]